MTPCRTFQVFRQVFARPRESRYLQGAWQVLTDASVGEGSMAGGCGLGYLIRS
jgi:hypothetical protein